MSFNYEKLTSFQTIKMSSFDIDTTVSTTVSFSPTLATTSIDLTCDDSSSERIDECEKCPICLEILSLENTFTIKGCGHLLCIDCEPKLRNTNLSTCYDKDKLIKVIKCPICRTPEEPSEDLLKKNIRERNLLIETMSFTIRELLASQQSNNNVPVPPPPPPQPQVNVIPNTPPQPQVVEQRILDAQRILDIVHTGIRPVVHQQVYIEPNYLPPRSVRLQRENARTTQPTNFVPEARPRPLPQQSGIHLAYCDVLYCRTRLRTRRLCRRGCGTICCAACSVCTGCRPRPRVN